MDDHIRVKCEKLDAMEHNAPTNTPGHHHRGELIGHVDLAADIREALPHLDSSYLNTTLRVVLDAGPEEPSDLQFLREEDFREHLSPLQCRRLVYYFTNKYRGGILPSVENGLSACRNSHRDRVSSSARTDHVRKKARMDPQDGFMNNSDYSPHNEAVPLDEHSPSKEIAMASDSSEKDSPASQGFVPSGPPLHHESLAGEECKPVHAASASTPHLPARGFQNLHHPAKSKFGTGRVAAGSVEGRINLMSNRISNLQKTVEHIRSVCEYTNIIVTEMSGAVPRPEPLTEEQLQPSPSCTFSFAPANTLEELDEILNNEEIVPYLKTCERDTLAGTLRTMLKNLLTRELAVQFSFTGLGAKRQRTKYSLKNHKLYRVFQQGVRATRHKSANLSDMDLVLKNVLKNALDWDGHRGHRRNQEAQQPLDPTRLCELSVGGQEATGHDYSTYAAQQWAASSMEGGLGTLSNQERWTLSE